MDDAATMLLVAGHPALDFVNTLGGLPEAPDDEYLHNYGDLLTWTRRCALLPGEEAERLAPAARTDAANAGRVLASALRLRAALDAVLRTALARQPLPADELATVGQAFARAATSGRLESTDTGLRWTWPAEPSDLSRPLWPVAVSAMDLLDRAPLDLLGRCQHCRWLFLDTSRNHTRRWCSMNACGGSDKMRRHRARSRTG